MSHIYDVYKPTYTQKKALSTWQQKFFTQFDEVEHGPLLEFLYGNCGARKASASRAKYEIVGNAWRRLGFQQENPRVDLLVGGELQLQCLVYFIKHQRTIALNMMNSRIRRDDFDKDNYPWAIIGLKLASMLGSIFEIYDPVANKITDCSTFRLQSFWHFIAEKDSFFRLFNATFILYDCYWDTVFAQEFKQKKYNFSFGMSMDWSLVVWPYHDILMDILTRCKDLAQFEAYAQYQYLATRFPETVPRDGNEATGEEEADEILSVGPIDQNAGNATTDATAAAICVDESQTSTVAELVSQPGLRSISRSLLIAAEHEEEESDSYDNSIAESNV